jgi:metal-responsive CopG/Arc/MetJ family transcriptional regulator
MTDTVRVQVLMPRAEADRFDAYCRELGFKKSTLIARLIREHLAEEHFTQQPGLFKYPAEAQGQR